MIPSDAFAASQSAHEHPSSCFPRPRFSYSPGPGRESTGQDSRQKLSFRQIFTASFLGSQWIQGHPKDGVLSFERADRTLFARKSPIGGFERKRLGRIVQARKMYIVGDAAIKLYS